VPLGILKIKITSGSLPCSLLINKLLLLHIIISGSDSLVGIATDYGQDDPGSNPGGDEIFRLPRPALGPTQPPVKWVLSLSRGKVRPERGADHSPPSSAAVMKE